MPRDNWYNRQNKAVLRRIDAQTNRLESRFRGGDYPPFTRVVTAKDLAGLISLAIQGNQSAASLAAATFAHTARLAGKRGKHG